MEIGCGARVRDFDGRRYFNFWHYERANGRSVRREDYVGRGEFLAFSDGQSRRTT